MSDKDFAQVAYEAYADSVNWTSVNGDHLPEWSDVKELNAPVAAAWRAVANTVIKHTIEWYRDFMAEQAKQVPQ